MGSARRTCWRGPSPPTMARGLTPAANRTQKKPDDVERKRDDVQD